MEKRTERINIYIEMKDKKKLDEIKYKYHLSYSTIANIIVYNYIHMDIATETFNYKTLQEKYIYGKKGTKTSIKPKTSYAEITKKSILFTNCLKIFIENDLEKYLSNEKKREKARNRIYADFQNRYEENWDGNRFQRIMPRIIKQNRQYYKRILENE